MITDFGFHLRRGNVARILKHMKRTLFILIALLLPATAFATTPPSTFSAARSLFATSSSPGNAYVAGATVVLTAPVAGDLSVVGGTITAAAPVAGDELLIGGSITTRAKVAGDLRAIGGSITVGEPVGGDLIAFGYSVDALGRAGGSVFIVAVNTTIVAGATGPVTIYGNNVSLGGTFGGNITIVAGGRVSVTPGTIIHGALTYEAPEPAVIPASVVIDGGVSYTSASYLPGASASRMLAIASIGVFLLVRILGALILAGLLAGLFPRPAEEIADRLSSDRPRRTLLTMALGFAILVTVPALVLLLLVTFVGIGIALLLFVAYLLLVMLALMYAGIVVGNLLARRFSHRENVLWQDGVIGMLVVSGVTMIPFIGLFIVLLLMTLTTGALISLFFRYSFLHEEKDELD